MKKKNGNIVEAATTGVAHIAADVMEGTIIRGMSTIFLDLTDPVTLAERNRTMTAIQELAESLAMMPCDLEDVKCAPAGVAHEMHLLHMKAARMDGKITMVVAQEIPDADGGLMLRTICFK